MGARPESSPAFQLFRLSSCPTKNISLLGLVYISRRVTGLLSLILTLFRAATKTNYSLSSESSSIVSPSATAEKNALLSIAIESNVTFPKDAEAI